jgi:hypothetical protein
LQQAEIVGGVLVVSHKDGVALTEPGKRPLYNPTARLATTLATRTCLFTDRADVSYITQGRGRFTTGGIIEPFVEQQMLLLVVWALDDDRKQRVFEAPSVMPVVRRGRDT